MDPAAPPPPLPLPAAAAERLHSSLSGMADSVWLDSLDEAFRRAEGLLCALHPGCTSLEEYLQHLSSGGGAAGGSGTGVGGVSGPCTRVWTAGTIAYRSALSEIYVARHPLLCSGLEQQALPL